MDKHPIYKDYSCDDMGNLYRDGRLIKGTIATTGYRQYRINRKSLLGHRIVTECRLGRLLRPDEVVNHLNFNKLDNSAGNLELTTATGNSHHYWANQRIDTSNVSFSDVDKSNINGEENPNSKLTNSQAESLILDLCAGMGNKEAASKYGLHDRYVSLIRHKKRWKSIWVKLGLESSTTRASCS